MPRRQDIQKILLIGSGPIVIGQACEFDYSGTQALRALKEEGYEVVLVNSNPATIMTDPALSDRVYVEPLTPETLETIIQKEKPDALLPTMGGQTALNLTMELHRRGVLEREKVEILGAVPEAIHRAEDRETFKRVIAEVGVESARSRVVRDLSEIDELIEDLGLPLILRPSFTLGGEGGGHAHTREELAAKIERALFLSPTHDVLVEESMLGWKEYELEVVRDKADNVIIVCSIENLDPMGVHTGDSITVAPAQTLTDREYQHLRDLSIAIIRKIGVETGGSNIQFSVNPRDGRVICIEMNPRVSRSSALASKATGFPIARVATKLAVGYTLDELTNDITQSTPCSFEPSIDYVVTKIPRFDFEKFRPTDSTLSTQMKSVGEVMAIGRTFEESLGKALAGIETGTGHFISIKKETDWNEITRPSPTRLLALATALRNGESVETLAERTRIDPWFIDRIRKHLEGMELLQNQTLEGLSREEVLELKKRGWTDRAISHALGVEEKQVRDLRSELNLHASFHKVDTCAAEFEAQTPYLYSSFGGEDESAPSNRTKVMVLGGGPNRIGQGIEFDYCCVHAAQALQDLGVETLMVNSNPETVSTDFDTSDKLYFEPLTVEHVLNIVRVEKPLGVIVQFGGQTPLKLAQELEAEGVRILGTSADAIDLAEDRKRCDSLVSDLEPLGLLKPPAGIARTEAEALEVAKRIGYPVLVRPSYVLGGRAMKIVRSPEKLSAWIEEAIEVTEKHPILIDSFLEGAVEVDVDALSDGHDCIIGGVMEHIEEAGIHSGDSASVLPTVTLSQTTQDRIRTFSRELARRFQVKGLMNIQFAVKEDRIYLIEVNPRASRTVPFISKATGIPLVKLAVQVILGKTLHDLGLKQDCDLNMKTFNVKAPVFPFDRFPGVDTLLGPEMRSTGEVMGRARSFPAAYSKAMTAAGMKLPEKGKVFLSIRNEDKAAILPLAKVFASKGFELEATHGTAQFLRDFGLQATGMNKVREGSPHCVEAIQRGDYALVINTTSNEGAIKDSFSIRRAALEKKVPYTTVLAAARALVGSLEHSEEAKTVLTLTEGQS